MKVSTVAAAVALVALTGCPLLTIGKAVPKPDGRPAGECSGSGWCWENPRPAGRLINASWAFGPDDVWFVGGEGDADGFVLAWDGKKLVDRAPAGLAGITAIWASSRNDVWCSTLGASVLHWDGSSWSNKLTGVPGPLRSVWGANGHIYLAGDGGLADIAAASWLYESDELAEDLRLFAITATSPSDVWAAGYSRTRPNGGSVVLTPVVLHFDGAKWSRIAVPLPGLFDFPKHAVALPDGKIWFAMNSTEMMVWDGAALTFPPGGSAEALWASADGHLFGAGFGDSPSLTLDGRPVGSIDTDAREGIVPRWSISGTQTNDVWIAASTALIAHWDGASLRMVSAPPLTYAELCAVHGTGPDDVWAVGTTALLHFNGIGWSTRSSSQLRDVYADQPGRAWVVGSHQVERQIGNEPSAAWTSTAELRAVHGSAPDDVWVVGDGVARRFDGTSWRDVGAPAGARLLDVFALAADDVWAVGSTAYQPPELPWLAAAFHWDGSAWKSFSLEQDPFDAQINAAVGKVWASGPSDVWATSDGVVWHFDGDRWSGAVKTAKTTPTFGDRNAITGTGPNDIWVSTSPLVFAVPGETSGFASVDDIGINFPFGHGPQSMIHFDGRTWTEESMPGQTPIDGLFADGANVWAVGANGLILKRQ